MANRYGLRIILLQIVFIGLTESAYGLECVRVLELLDNENNSQGAPFELVESKGALPCFTLPANPRALSALCLKAVSGEEVGTLVTFNSSTGKCTVLEKVAEKTIMAVSPHVTEYGAITVTKQSIEH